MGAKKLDALRADYESRCWPVGYNEIAGMIRAFAEPDEAELRPGDEVTIEGVDAPGAKFTRADTTSASEHDDYIGVRVYRCRSKNDYDVWMIKRSLVHKKCSEEGQR